MRGLSGPFDWPFDADRGVDASGARGAFEKKLGSGSDAADAALVDCIDDEKGEGEAVEEPLRDEEGRPGSFEVDVVALAYDETGSSLFVVRLLIVAEPLSKHSRSSA